MATISNSARLSTDESLCKLTLDHVSRKGIVAKNWLAAILDGASITKATSVMKEFLSQQSEGRDIYSLESRKFLNCNLKIAQHEPYLLPHLAALENRDSWNPANVDRVIATLCLIQDLKDNASVYANPDEIKICDLEDQQETLGFDHLMHLLISHIAKVKKISERFFTLEKLFFYTPNSKTKKLTDRFVCEKSYRLLLLERNGQWQIKRFALFGDQEPSLISLSNHESLILSFEKGAPFKITAPTISISICSAIATMEVSDLLGLSGTKQPVPDHDKLARVSFCFGENCQNRANTIHSRFLISPNGEITSLADLEDIDELPPQRFFGPDLISEARRRSLIALDAALTSYKEELSTGDMHLTEQMAKTYIFVYPQTTREKAFVEYQLLEDLRQNPETNAPLIEWIAQETGFSCTQEEIDLAQVQLSSEPTAAIIELSEMEEAKIETTTEPTVLQTKELSPAIVVQIMVNQAREKMETLSIDSAKAIGPSKEELAIKKAAKEERSKTFKKAQRALSKKEKALVVTTGAAAAGSESLDLDEHEKALVTQVLEDGHHLKTSQFRKLIGTILRKKSEQLDATIRQHQRGSHPKIHITSSDGRCFGITLQIPHGSDPNDMQLFHQKQTLYNLLGL